MLSYYGHCAFLWTSPAGVRVLIDPFGNSDQSRWFLDAFPPLEADVVLVTHDHFDHNADHVVPGKPTLIRGPGRFQPKDVEITGVLDLHSGRSGLRGMTNTIFVVELEGIRYAHIGDNRHDAPDAVRRAIGRVDVLMLTVDDSNHLLTSEQVDSLTALLDPRVVVPMHYYIEGLTTVESTLKAPDGWLSSQPRVRRLQNPTLSLRTDDIPEEREVWVFPPLLP
ncbi:MAG: MBL fold metallo-hydrolase [Chloroflexi bacterium]|nr:MBL fold metallo-hydrolase [Chloroflexota bacterium]